MNYINFSYNGGIKKRVAPLKATPFILRYFAVFCAFVFLHDTPRWLLSKNKVDEAREVFKKLSDNSPASYALRFVAQLPNVLTTLSGMSTYEQVEDNINTFNECKPLSDEEMKAVEEANILFLPLDLKALEINYYSVYIQHQKLYY